MLVIGLTGFASAGKGMAADFLKTRGFVKMVFSDVLRDEAVARGIDLGRDLEGQKLALSRLGDVLRKDSGKNEILAERLVEKIKSSPHEKVVVDGFRAPAEANLFRNNFGKNFKLLHIIAGVDTRFQRRKLDDPHANFDRFKERDRNDVEKKGMAKVFEAADFIIDNNDNMESTKKQITDILNLLLSSV